ncbi:hypothetical protein DVH24_030527 [Malus domestica]|uniref:Bidirectional sugar transporter SWEET n=1 Tax=Malus domestica TaxID=3750 RepID=A0A498JY79_MALDO|nr:hypothetical protein DVH24_030527 [Malus domestica]
MDPKTMHVFKVFFGVIGNGTALFLFLAPTITFRRIIRKRSTEQFSGIPYVMTMLNCLLSAWYAALLLSPSSLSLSVKFLVAVVLTVALIAMLFITKMCNLVQKYGWISVYGLPFVSPNNILVSTINGTGAAIELIYVLIFIIFAPKRERAKILGLFTAVLALFSAVALVSLFTLHDKTRKLFCGLAATVFSVIMYSSPFSIMSTVVRTKSVEFMPFFLSLFSFLCGTSWFIFGLLGHDPFVAIPNGFGSGLGALQLLLYFIYRDNKGKGSGTKKPNGAATTADESMEMGVAKPDQQPKQSITINGAQDGHV